MTTYIGREPLSLVYLQFINLASEFLHIFQPAKEGSTDRRTEEGHGRNGAQHVKAQGPTA